MVERIEGTRSVRRVSFAPVTGAAPAPTHPEIAGRSGLLATAKALAAQPMPVDQARVGQLRQAIQDGSYTLDPQSIARAMQDWSMQTTDRD